MSSRRRTADHEPAVAGSDAAHQRSKTARIAHSPAKRGSSSSAGARTDLSALLPPPSAVSDADDPRLRALRDLRLCICDGPTQFTVFKSRLTVKGELGYRMIRCTHGVQEGDMYFEVRFNPTAEQQSSAAAAAAAAAVATGSYNTSSDATTAFYGSAGLGPDALSPYSTSSGFNTTSGSSASSSSSSSSSSSGGRDRDREKSEKEKDRDRDRHQSEPTAAGAAPPPASPFLSSPSPANIRVGWSRERGDLDVPVGFDEHSYGYGGSLGRRFHRSLGRDYAIAPAPGDVIGCLISLPVVSTMHGAGAAAAAAAAAATAADATAGNGSVDDSSNISRSSSSSSSSSGRIAAAASDVAGASGAATSLPTLSQSQAHAQAQLLAAAASNTTTPAAHNSTAVEADRLMSDLKDQFRRRFTTLHGSSITFFRNGKSLGRAFDNIPGGPYFPAVSLYNGASVTLNFGPDFACPPPGCVPRYVVPHHSHMNRRRVRVFLRYSK